MPFFRIIQNLTDHTVIIQIAVYKTITEHASLAETIFLQVLSCISSVTYVYCWIAVHV